MPSYADRAVFSLYARDNAQARKYGRKPLPWTRSMPRRTRGLRWTYWRERLRWSADPQIPERALALAQQALAWTILCR